MPDKIRRTLLGAIGYVYFYKIQFLKILAFPFIFFSVYYLTVSENSNIIFSWIILLTSWIIYTQVAVSTHRIILLGPNAVPNWGIYLPTFRELHFFMTSFILGIMMLPLLLFMAIPGIGIIMYTIASAYLISRFSLVFPTIAIDNPMTFSDSWAVTKNYQILMLTVVLIFPIVVSIPEILFDKLPHTEIIVTAVSLITLVLMVAALSVSYKVINENM